MEGFFQYRWIFNCIFVDLVFIENLVCLRKANDFHLLVLVEFRLPLLIYRYRSQINRCGLILIDDTKTRTGRKVEY